MAGNKNNVRIGFHGSLYVFIKALLEMFVFQFKEDPSLQVFRLLPLVPAAASLP